MRLCAFLRLIALATVIISCESREAYADTPDERKTLTGLKSVNVLVEYLSQDLKESGLSTATLQTDAELRLRSAGIRVATEREMYALPGNPYLYVRVNGGWFRTTSGQKIGYSASVEVTLHQIVRLERDSSIITE